MLSLIKVRIDFPREEIYNLALTIKGQLAASKELFTGRRRIAVAVGSRGINNLREIVVAVISGLRAIGVDPFIIPAMGSHGGATDEGQAHVLASYGITEEGVGCSIRSSMEVVQLDPNGLPHPLFMDRHAHEADGILLINRIKPHTDFHGRYESGLMKMAVIGLGKEKQAVELHNYGVHGLKNMVPAAARVLLGMGKIIGGIGIVEGSCEETMVAEFIPASRIPDREPELLEIARARLPRLPVKDLHLLIVDQIGKNISGCGMDTNVVGRIRIPGEEEPAEPRIQTILVDDLTPETQGNATGMGVADVITQKFFSKIDFPSTNKNILVSGFLERGKMPVVASNAATGITACLRACGRLQPGTERIARIRNTLHLSEIWVSQVVAKELEGHTGITFMGESDPAVLPDGNLRPF